MVHRRRRSRYYSSSSSSSDSSSWSSSSSSSSDSRSSWSSSSSSSSDSCSSWSSSSSSSSDSRSSWSSSSSSSSDSSSSSSSDSRSSWSSSSSSSSDSDSSSSRSSPAKRLKTSNHGSSKRLKTSCDNNSNVGIDRISELPDLVLHHILSYIDMQEVIGNTSLISKRWRNLWLSLPILNFDHSSSMRRRNDKHSFSRFIDRVLLRRDNSFIKSLSISICHRYPPPMRSFEDWMIYAARKNVEQVSLNIRDLCFDIPQNLLWPQFSKIQVFKLKAAGRNLLIPHSLFLDTQLKYLYLDSVRLPEAKEVTLSCSVLENLTITCCTHRHVNILKISSPKLTNLELTNEFQDFNETCKLQISAPNLTSLLLNGTMYQGYSFENLTSLVKARIDFHEELDDADFLRNILEGLHNVTTLELCIYGGISGWNTIDKSLHMVDHHRGLLNTFVNLKCLKLNEWSAGSSCMHVIRSLLTNSYFLEDLVLKIDVVRDAHDWRELFPCIHRLKSFEIQDVKGSRHELKLFEFILKNAVVLEDFTIHSHWKFRKYAGRKELAKFNMKIHALHRASSSVKILVFFPK